MLWRCIWRVSQVPPAWLNAALAADFHALFTKSMLACNTEEPLACDNRNSLSHFACAELPDSF